MHSDMVFEKKKFPIILLNTCIYMGRYLIDINTVAHTHTLKHIACSHTYTRTCTCMYSTCIHTRIDIQYTYIKLAHVSVYMYIYIHNWIYLYIEYTYIYTNHPSLSKIKAKCFDFWKNRYSLFHLWCVCVLLCFITPRPFLKTSSIWYLKLKVFSLWLLKRVMKCVRALNLENPFKNVTEDGIGCVDDNCFIITLVKII